MNNLRKAVFRIVDENNKKYFYSRFFNLFIVALILLNVLAIILDSFQGLRTNFKDTFHIFEIFSVVIFTIEYALRLWTAKYKFPQKTGVKATVTYFFSANALIDLLAILPFYVPFLIPIDLRFIRIIRLVRLSRILKLNRYSRSLKLIGDVVREKKAELGMTIFVTFILLLMASSIMYELEHDVQPEAFPNIIASFWWAIATLTTVGYGDVYPVTGWGKFISAIIAFLGIGLIALPTGILSAAFFEKIKNTSPHTPSPETNVLPEKDKDVMMCPHCGKEIHCEATPATKHGPGRQ